MRVRGIIVASLTVAAWHAATAVAALDLTSPLAGDFAAVEITGIAPVASQASMGAWSVDATGVLTGWHVTVGATQFRAADGSTLPLRSMTLRGPTVSAGSGQLPATYPVTLVTRSAPVPIDLSADGSGTVGFVNALSGTGSGIWNFGQGSADLEISVPVGAKAGAYTSTITFTLSPGPV